MDREIRSVILEGGERALEAHNPPCVKCKGEWRNIKIRSGKTKYKDTTQQKEKEKRNEKKKCEDFVL